MLTITDVFYQTYYNLINNFTVLVTYDFDCSGSCEKESETLPNPRAISLAFSNDRHDVDPIINNMAVFFGQFLNHDMVLSPKHESKNCCDETNDDTECNKIEFPPDDPFYSQWNQTCLPLTRSSPIVALGGLQKSLETNKTF